MPELQLQIVEVAREHGRVTIGQTIELTGVDQDALKVSAADSDIRATVRPAARRVDYGSLTRSLLHREL
jgi:hypothetical protein